MRENGVCEGRFQLVLKPAMRAFRDCHTVGIGDYLQSRRYVHPAVEKTAGLNGYIANVAASLRPTGLPNQRR